MKSTKDVLKECLSALEFRDQISILATHNRTISENDMATMERACKERNELVKLLLEGNGYGEPFEDSRQRYHRALERLKVLLNREW